MKNMKKLTAQSVPPVTPGIIRNVSSFSASAARRLR